MPWNQISVLWSREVEGLSPGCCQDSSSITYSFSPASLMLQICLSASMHDCTATATSSRPVGPLLFLVQFGRAGASVHNGSFKWIWRSVIRNKRLSSHITQLKPGLLVQRCSDGARHPRKRVFIWARWSQSWLVIEVHESEKPALGYSNSQLAHISCSSMQGHVVYL